MQLRQVAWPLVVAFALGACSSESPKASAVASPISTKASSAFPENRCDGATPELTACVAKVFEHIDRERARLSAHLVSAAVQPELLQPFRGTLPNLGNEWRRSESAFLALRDHTCTAVFVARYPGTAASGEQITCEISLTRSRIAFLRAALEGKGNFP